MSQPRSMTREIGTALAVLAIYLLTVLAPLHHARATQLDFQALGYETTQTGWVLCTSSETRKDSDTSLVSKCPASGIGKNDVVEPSHPAIDIGAVASLTIEPGPAPRAVPSLSTLNPAAPPRAPPTLV